MDDTGTEVNGSLIPDNDEDEAEEVIPQPSQFQFVDLTAASMTQQNRNRSIVRSHVMRAIRRSQRQKKNQLRPKPIELSSGAKVKGSDKALDVPTGSSSMTLPVRQAEHQLQSRAALANQVLSRSTWATNSAKLSLPSMMESILGPSTIYQGKVTPLFHQLIEFYNTTLLPTWWPGERADEPSPLAVDLFTMMRSNLSFFYASLYAAAVQMDMMQSTTYLTESVEMQRNKYEAIRLINEELAKGSDFPDAVIFAVLCLVNIENDDVSRDQLEKDKDSPFKIPPLAMQCQRLYASVRTENMHSRGARAMLRMKGGVLRLQERLVASAIARHLLILSAFELSKPVDPDFYEIPEILKRAMDPNVNALMHPLDSHRGSGLSGLLVLGLTEEALSVMMDMLRVIAMVEGHAAGTLVNLDITALSCRRDRTHHRLLSLPRGAELSPGPKTNFYECCRLAALMFADAVLFPMPGIRQRLVAEIKQCVEKINLTVLHEGRRFFIWILMLTGIAAIGMPERLWLEQRLLPLLSIEGVSRWVELKKIVTSFLWMDSACDGGAIILWDEIAAVLRTPGSRNDRSTSAATSS